MIRNKAKYTNLLNVLLFTGLGCFSYFFLIRYTDISAHFREDFSMSKVLMAVVVTFNVLGLGMIYICRKIDEAYPRLFYYKDKIKWYAFLYAVSLFLLNYLLLVSVKWMLGISFPFAIRWSGIRMLLIIWIVELVIVTLVLINNFYRQLLYLYRRNEMLEESSVKAQYRALQNQLNPHFLFNSLNTLIAEIEYNPSNAVTFTRYLSDVYRYILQCQDHQIVTLKSELDFLDAYVFLQKVRLGECIEINSSIPERFLYCYLPPLTVQLLVENIFKHNVINFSNPMHIELYVEEETNLLCVENKVRRKQGTPVSGRGLQNLSQRYNLLAEQSIVVQDNEDFFLVKVPLLQK